MTPGAAWISVCIVAARSSAPPDLELRRGAGLPGQAAVEQARQILASERRQVVGQLQRERRNAGVTTEGQ